MISKEKNNDSNDDMTNGTINGKKTLKRYCNLNDQIRIFEIEAARVVLIFIGSVCVF